MKTTIRHLAAPGFLALCLALAGPVPAMAQSSVIDLPPPQVQDYWVSISRQSGGTLVFDGYAPSASLRSALGETPNADISFLKLGSGAPARYDEAVQFGLAMLNRLSEGRFALRDDVVTVSGTAASQADFIALTGAQAPKPPSGLILAKSEIAAPRLENYAFSLRKQANGNVIVGGYVPNPALEQTILSSVGVRSSSTLRFASGEPVNFAAAVEKAIPLLALLSEGEIKLENSAWLVSGTPASAANAEAIRAAFADEQLASSGWSLALGQAAASAPEPVFAWTLQKLPSGAVQMSGAVPTEAFKRVIGLRIGDAFEDKSTVAASAPDHFITDALAAADALKLLASGSASYDGKTWSVTGEAATPGGSALVAKALGEEASAWHVAVTDPVAPPPAAPPTIASEPEPSEPAATNQVAAEPAQETTASVSTAPRAATNDIAACSATLSQLSAQNGILFKSGAALLADGAEPVLAAMAAAANQCPVTALDVAGHTDSDGEASANLALSVARAEAVINALINLGVDPSRLYAIGYGESQPVADNGTAAGKAQNRRIVVSIRQAN